MKGDRKSREMKEQVLDLHRRKHGKKTIARMLGLSRNTVKGIIKAAEAVASGNGAEASPEGWTDAVDWSSVRDQLKTIVPSELTTVNTLNAEARFFAPKLVWVIASFRVGKYA